MHLSPTGRFLDDFHALDADPAKKFAGSPPSKKLSMLLRPAFIAEPGKTLVWGDWSAIEARVLPWLAASPGAEAVLDIFRESDNDKTKPDIYMRTAADLMGFDPYEMWSYHTTKGHPRKKEAGDIRQSRGKVPVLSLGFGGALGALMAMATNYGVYLDTETATRVVQDWRNANQWARDFWGAHSKRDGSWGLWGAANSAIERPDTVHSAGRVAYVYDRAYMGGTLFCALPCGRLLTYPGIKWEWREVEDKKTKQLVERYQMTCIKGYARVPLWYGKLAENITQATAASVLRRTLKRLDPATNTGYDWLWKFGIDPLRGEHPFPVVMHTHDEVVGELSEADTELARMLLQKTMETNDDWDQGLPLKVDIGGGWWYTKATD